MARRNIHVALLLLGCGSSPAESGGIPTSSADVASPGALSSLGIEDQLSGAGAISDTARAIRALSPGLTQCLCASLERDPTLTGQVVFKFDATQAGSASVSAEGDLANAAMTACARSVLESAAFPLSARGDGWVYRISLKGDFRASPLPGGAPPLGRVLVAVSEASGWENDVTFEAQLDGISEALRRCIVAGGIESKEPYWFVLRVEPDGAVILAPGEPSEATSTTAQCLRRHLGAARLQPRPSATAVSLLLGSGDQAPFVSRRYAANFEMVPVNGPTEAPNTSGGELTARGNLWGAGDLGLGLSGIGERGGGAGEGIGLGSVETGGRSGRLAGMHSKPPTVRMGATTVVGDLPPEVIQRVVRQNFGRFRLCYESGLQKNPNLQGTVKIAFVIGHDGTVGSVTGGGDLPDANVTSCVSKGFNGLTFPAPQSGTVSVTYPIVFSPGESVESVSAAPAPTPTIGQRSLRDVDTATIVNVLTRKGYGAREVPTPVKSSVMPVVFARDPSNHDLLTVHFARGTGWLSECALVDGDRAVVLQGATCSAATAALRD